MSQVIYIIILFVLPILTGAVSAQTSLKVNSNTLKTPETTSTSSSIKSRNEFELQQSEYLSFALPEYRDSAAKQNSNIILRLDEQLDKGAFTARLKAKDMYSATEHWNYGDVHEFYTSLHGDSSEVALGRKLETWSAWDEEWQQGAFQPRYMENRMRSEQAGLTGLFGNVHNEHLSATVGALAFIPDFSAHFYVKDDHFFSKNPWFHPPTDSFLLRGAKGDIHYRLNHPETASVIEHAGVAGKFEFKNHGYLARASYAYKPMPQFILGFPSERQFESNATEDHMNITVNPRVVYDRVVNLDNLYTSGPWSLSGSAAYSNPVDRGASADWTSQQVRSATIFSGAVGRRLEDAGIHASSVRVGFLKVHGGDAEDSGPLAGKETLFERRFQFYEAYLLGFHKD
ncbi:MAG: hypothetical protein ACXVA9_10445, partial [Bdellovibrionales bacterium]